MKLCVWWRITMWRRSDDDELKPRGRIHSGSDPANTDKPKQRHTFTSLCQIHTLLILFLTALRPGAPPLHFIIHLRDWNVSHLDPMPQFQPFKKSQSELALNTCVLLNMLIGLLSLSGAKTQNRFENIYTNTIDGCSVFPTRTCVISGCQQQLHLTFDLSAAPESVYWLCYHNCF